MLPFKLKLKNESKAKDKVNRVKISERNKQLDAAVQWCKEHNCRGYAAINSGLFPLIKDRRTINNRLDETVATGNEKHYCRILTIEEETSIVRHIKNSNRCFQGLSKVELTKLILDVLRVRDFANKKLKGGRGFIRLSKNAKDALERNKLGRSFWRWDAVHTDLVRKRQGNICMNRALNCTITGKEPPR